MWMICYNDKACMFRVYGGEFWFVHDSHTQWGCYDKESTQFTTEKAIGAFTEQFGAPIWRRKGT